MKKYKSYSPVICAILFLGLAIGLWMIFKSISNNANKDTTDLFVLIVGIVLTVGDICLMSEALIKTSVTDTYISRRNFLFQEKKIFFQDISRFEVSSPSYDNYLFLYTANDKIKIPFCDKNFVIDMYDILKKHFASETKEKIENIKKNGIQIQCFKYQIQCDEKGITKNNAIYKWSDIQCLKKKSKTGTNYVFFLDKEIQLGTNKINFSFAIDDFFEEMTKECIVRN
jgi:hypothetical protein